MGAASRSKPFGSWRYLRQDRRARLLALTASGWPLHGMGEPSARPEPCEIGWAPPASAAGVSRETSARGRRAIRGIHVSRETSSNWGSDGLLA